MITVGFTYDFKDDYLAQGFSSEDAAEFDSIGTIEAIESALMQSGYLVERIGNIQSLVQKLASHKRWDIVFNICEGVKGIGREAQVPALLEAYGIPYVFSPSEVMITTMDKSLAKRIVASHGIPTANFKVIYAVEDLQDISLPFPLFAKPIAEGTSKGITQKSLIKDSSTLQSTVLGIIKQFKQPALVERYLPGRDLTVGIIGSGKNARALGVMETHYRKGAEAGSQSFYNKEHYENLLDYVLIHDETAKAAAEIALKSWQALHCLDAGRVDLRCDEHGLPHFIEVNPLAGLNPIRSDLAILTQKAGIPYNQLIHEIMENALTRHGIVASQPLKSEPHHESCCSF